MTTRRRLQRQSSESKSERHRREVLIHALSYVGDIYARLVGLATQLRNETSPDYREHVRRTAYGYRRVLAERSVCLMRALTNLKEVTDAPASPKSGTTPKRNARRRVSRAFRVD